MANDVRLIDADAFDTQLVQEETDSFGFPGIPRARALLKVQATIDPRDLRGTAYWKERKPIWFLFRVKVPVVCCSNCSNRFADALKPGFYEYRFCPNCGAKMEV